MSIKSLVFCDICNKKNVSSPDERRKSERSGAIGRRGTDGRHCFEGSLDEAIEAGWAEDSRGRHICPRCKAFLGMT